VEGQPADEVKVASFATEGGVAMAAPGSMRNSQEEGDTSVQTIAENGTAEVPSRFIRSESERISFTPHSTLSLEPIPTIDLEGLLDFRRQFTMAAIFSACRHWGCFQAISASTFLTNTPQS